MDNLLGNGFWFLVGRDCSSTTVVLGESELPGDQLLQIAYNKTCINRRIVINERSTCVCVLFIYHTFQLNMLPVDRLS